MTALPGLSNADMIEPNFAANPEDLAAVADLLTLCGLPTAGLEDAADCLILRRDGQVMASAALEIHGHSGLLRSVAVHPALQKQGVGRALTARTITLARERGLARLYLLTESAVGYFPRFGFTVIDRADVDGAIQRSVEFTTACPSTAAVMALFLT